MVDMPMGLVQDDAMDTSCRPIVGVIYYLVEYEGDDGSRPILTSCKYLERVAKDAEDREHIFTMVGPGYSGEELFLRERDLDTVFDLPGLLKELGGSVRGEAWQ